MPHPRLWTTLAIAAAVAAAVCPFSPVNAAPRQAAPRVSTELRDKIAATGSADVVVILDVAPGLSRAARQAAVARAQDEVLRPFAPGEIRGLYRFSMTPALAGHVNAEQLARLEASPRVLAIGPNLPGTGGLSQSRPHIGADRANRAGAIGAGVHVAVIDSGVDSDHPDLTGALIGEQCFCQGSVLGDGVGCCPNGLETQAGAGAAEDDLGHGTNVTGIIMSRGDRDLAAPGIAPAAEVVAVKVIDSNNSGFLLDWSKALDWVLANRPDVKLLNMSLQSGATYTDVCDGASAVNMAMGTSITSLRTMNGATTIAISGNFGLNGATVSPGCLADAVMVGAVYDYNYGPASFSSGFTCSETSAVDKPTCFSNTDNIVDLLAPGYLVVSDVFGGWFTAYSGTSMAAPHVVGTAALVLSREPGLTPAALVARLTSTGVPVVDTRNGLTFPRIDAAAALLDLDADGVSNTADNCPERVNPGQENADSDPAGDACDNCPAVAGASQADVDHDGAGDLCDASPNTFLAENLFVVDPAGGGTIYQLDRMTHSIVNSFPTPEPVVGGGSGLGWSSRRATLFYTNGTTAGIPTIYELDSRTGAVLNSFPQTNIDGLSGMTGLAGSAGGLLSLSIQPANSDFLASPYDGSIFTTGFFLGGDLTGQGAVGANDYPLSIDDHAGWFSRNINTGVPAPAVAVNQLQLLEFGSGFSFERLLTPTRCVSPGPDGILQTAPAAGDQVIAGEIQIGADNACNTLVAAGDDLAGCVDAGPDNVVNTLPAADDVVAGRVIVPGPNQACNTTVPAAGDIPGGILNRKVNGLGATGPLLFASAADPTHDVLYIMDAFASPTTSPRSGPTIIEGWPDPTPDGPIEAIAAGPSDTDFDGVINDEDNCRAVVNLGQSDADADRVGDICDNCPADANPAQENFDGDAEGDACDLDDDNDGVSDGSDCESLDGSVWRTPGEVAEMTFTDGVTLGWIAPADPGGTAVAYDTLRADTPGDFVGGTLCVETADGADTAATDPSIPAPGSFSSYLIVPVNACGRGPAGFDSMGAERPARSCP